MKTIWSKRNPDKTEPFLYEEFKHPQTTQERQKNTLIMRSDAGFERQLTLIEIYFYSLIKALGETAVTEAT